MSRKAWDILGAVLLGGGAWTWRALVDGDYLTVGSTLVAALIGSKLGWLLEVVWSVVRWFLREAVLRPTPYAVIGGLLGAVGLVGWGFSERSDDDLPLETFLLLAAEGYVVGAFFGACVKGLTDGFAGLREMREEEEEGE